MSWNERIFYCGLRAGKTEAMRKEIERRLKPASQDSVVIMEAVNGVLKPLGFEVTSVCISERGFGRVELTVKAMVAVPPPVPFITTDSLTAMGKEVLELPDIDSDPNGQFYGNLGLSNFGAEMVKIQAGLFLESRTAREIMDYDNFKTEYFGTCPPGPEASVGKTVSNSSLTISKNYDNIRDYDEAEELVQKVREEFRKSVGNVDNVWKMPLAPHQSDPEIFLDPVTQTEIRKAVADLGPGKMVSIQQDGVEKAYIDTKGVLHQKTLTPPLLPLEIRTGIAEANRRAEEALKYPLGFRLELKPCECGAHKATGAPRGPGHASYCPWGGRS